MTYRGLGYVDVKSANITNTTLGGITSVRAFQGSDVRSEATSGEAYARWQAIYGQRPGLQFTTKALAAALDVCAQAGCFIDPTGVGKTGVTAYWQKQKQGGTRESGSNHATANIRQGIMIPRRISVGHQGDCELDYDVLATYDLSNAPLVFADSVALPSAPNDDQRYTIGPVTINGDTFAKVTNFSLDFGINAETIGADSDTWDTYSRIVEIMPMIELDGIDTDWFDDCNQLEGTNVLHTETEIILRKRLLGGRFEDPTDAVHISFSVCGLAYCEELASARQNGLATTKLRIPLRFDGTNLPIVIDTTAAYA